MVHTITQAVARVLEQQRTDPYSVDVHYLLADLMEGDMAGKLAGGNGKVDAIHLLGQ